MSKEARALRTVYQRYLDQRWELHPDEASARGLTAYNHRLGSNGPETHRKTSELTDATLKEIEAIPGSRLTGDDWLDRRCFLAMLRTEELLDGSGSTRPAWRTNPDAHAHRAVEAVFDLVVRHAGNLRPVLPAILDRLRALPRFLDEAASCVKSPVPLWTQLAAQTCQGAISFLKGLEPTLRGNSNRPDQLTSACEAAAEGFARFSRNLERIKPGHADSYAVGPATFEILLRERTGLDLSPAEVQAIGHRCIAEISAELAVECRQFGRGSASDIIEKFRGQWTPEGAALLDAYRTTTEAIRDRMVEKQIVTLPPGESLQVLPVPAFLRHSFPTAAYNQPPAFSRRQEGIFWVNDLTGEARSKQAKQSEVAQHFGLELTCAHEAYPGHHLQFFVQNQHPSKMRRLFHHAIFYEGWTLWCEKMCVEHGIYTAPWARLIQLHDALWRACRIVIDCGIQTGQMTLAQASKMLVEKVGFTKKRAEVDLNWYTSSPTVPLSYLMGRMELEQLHDEMTAQRGWSLCEFNDWILSYGAVPWNWIREANRRTL